MHRCEPPLFSEEPMYDKLSENGNKKRRNIHNHSLKLIQKTMSNFAFVDLSFSKQMLQNTGKFKFFFFIEYGEMKVKKQTQKMN